MTTTNRMETTMPDEDTFAESRAVLYEGMSLVERELVHLLYALSRARTVTDVNVAAGVALQKLGMERVDG